MVLYDLSSWVHHGESVLLNYQGHVSEFAGVLSGIVVPASLSYSLSASALGACPPMLVSFHRTISTVYTENRVEFEQIPLAASP